MRDLEQLWRLMTARRRGRRMPAGRVARYYGHRIGRLPGSPHDIAAGFAVGLAVSVTPFIGFHLLMGLVICWFLRLSNMGMIIGTVLGGNPWTFPAIWVGTYQLGAFLLAMEGTAGAGHGFTMKAVFTHPLELLLPMLVGSIPVGLALGLAGYYPVRRLVARYRAREHARAEATPQIPGEAL
jgi:uncharacterized protein (DUF2062 family)